jgi:hypothetical protein
VGGLLPGDRLREQQRGGRATGAAGRRLLTRLEAALRGRGVCMGRADLTARRHRVRRVWLRDPGGHAAQCDRHLRRRQMALDNGRSSLVDRHPHLRYVRGEQNRESGPRLGMASEVRGTTSEVSCFLADEGNVYFDAISGARKPVLFNAIHSTGCAASRARSRQAPWESRARERRNRCPRAGRARPRRLRSRLPFHQLLASLKARHLPMPARATLQQ